MSMTNDAPDRASPYEIETTAPENPKNKPCVMLHELVR